MPPIIALLLYTLFILWLFVRDRKLRPLSSGALWIPLVWFVILGSRPVSLWFGGGIQTATVDTYLEGSLYDRAIFLLLIILGFIALWSRKIEWRRIFATNGWVFALILYWGISTVWSDYPFVSFKRWIKEVGNVIMVLIILTEQNPVQATKAVFARCTYLLIPVSVLLIKYFPEFGRYYNSWTWEAAVGGVTIEKNALGSIALFCGLFLLWELIEMRTTGSMRTDRKDIFGRCVMLLMVFWLMGQANSSTALVCLILGSSILLFMRPPLGMRRAGHLGMYGLALGTLIFLLYSVFGGFELAANMVGRDMTLTGRTEIWANLLKEPVNPLLGSGYQGFWIPEVRERYYRINQAHNGYLEMYLNGGLVGLCLLMAIIILTASKLKKELLLGGSFGVLGLSFFVAVIFMNWTEAAFGGLSFPWIAMLISALNYPRSPIGSPEYMVNVHDRSRSSPK